MKYVLDLDESSCVHECGMNFYQCKQVPWWNVSDKIISKLPPYTEPDRKAIEDEVWELADYVVRMGSQERNLCFGFKFTTEVTANLSYQEAKAKFEKWVEKDEKETSELEEVVALANKLGIHKLYSLVKEIRGE